MTKKSSSEEFIQSAYDNIVADRKRLEALYDDVSRVAKSADDALGLAAVSENLVKITDSLTKQTGQVVELAKLKQKAELGSKVEGEEEDGPLSDGDTDEVYDAIEQESN